jgi:hypothetical protein
MNRYNHRNKYATSSYDMTDIPTIKSNNGYSGEGRRDNSRSQSPQRLNPGKSAEMLSSDVIQINEEKVRRQIQYSNNYGVSGPFINFGVPFVAPKCPQIPMGTSAYKMSFSPAKHLSEIPKLSASSSSISAVQPMSIRHIANVDALRSRRDTINVSLSRKPKVKYAHNMSLDNMHDDFRFKKNLTNNADRILTNNADRILAKPVSFKDTPGQEHSTKFDEVRRNAHQLLASNGRTLNGHSRANAMSKSINNGYGHDNHDNHDKYATVNVKDMISKPNLRVAAGEFNTSSLKKSMDFSPKNTHDNVMHTQKPKFMKFLQMNGFNDLSYARKQSSSNYGFDVLTGMRKNVPGSLL